MSTYVDKPLSLIEKKKLQWAKEKEELAGLCAPWSSKDSQNYDRPFQRTRYVPKFAMANNNEFFRKDFSGIGRRSSLPPLYKNQYNSVDKEMGGETSGYGSDNPNQNPENGPTTTWNQSGYESSSSYKDDRPKWKDKSNKFWDTSENDPPNWVKRGLQRDEEIVVSNTSPAESPQQDDGDQDRPNTSCSSLNRTFIRGQNIPVDSTELAERERRRQVALAHQEAIRQQLEEREKRRQEEKQKRIKEEQEEELRIEREQEIERQRKEGELRAIREKQERERRRKEAIQEALEIAEKEAKLEKIKQKRMKQSNLVENCEAETEVIRPTIIHNNIEKEDNEIKSKNLEQQNNLTLSPKQEVLNNEVNNNLEVTGKCLTTPRNNDNRSITPNLNNNSRQNNKSPCSFQILTTPRTEMALVLQTPLETLQNMQYAVLMPSLGNNTPSAVPIAIPLTLATDINTGSVTSRTENRILTPTQYRNKNRAVCDSSTQTEQIEFNNRSEAAENTNNNQKYIREKLTNLELNYDNRNRKERRSRSDDRSVDEKPKWGANRPPTRYMKQSEKDPFYQRRKMRQKTRDYKNSSDESQTGSPRTYRKKNYIEKRHTRALWRKNDHFFARNIRMYQTEIVPLESDKEQIYYRQKCECCCRCGCQKRSETKTEILKIEHTSPRDRLPDCNENVENAAYIIDKLTSLHNGLVLKQEQWERSPRTPIFNMAKLDDFLGKKKETAPILDLSKTVATNQEEFRRLLEKVPDFKIKSEKVHMESIKIKDKKFKFKSGKKDVKVMKEPYTFLDPLPREMKNLKITELAAVPIDWKMLTTIRPKSKLEENYFSRLVELKKLENKTRAFEKRQFVQDPQIRKLKNKAGVVEMRIITCVDCGEDFCNGIVYFSIIIK
ncbi:WRKY transcription factor protein 1 [Asbolus verrucosus]|uniref:WRKY transcription factor protein 1 n=1 Tax=Asbolus verrucosus TaxID=1661398 RepID=A0A482W4N5_ASBVE|nr:WRKY transcription factor protein 1 [Asbolus verrucosus]